MNIAFILFSGLVAIVFVVKALISREMRLRKSRLDRRENIEPKIAALKTSISAAIAEVDPSGRFRECDLEPVFDASRSLIVTIFRGDGLARQEKENRMTVREALHDLCGAISARDRIDGGDRRVLGAMIYALEACDRFRYVDQRHFRSSASRRPSTQE